LGNARILLTKSPSVVGFNKNAEFLFRAVVPAAGLETRPTRYGWRFNTVQIGAPSWPSLTSQLKVPVEAIAGNRVRQLDFHIAVPEVLARGYPATIKLAMAPVLNRRPITKSRLPATGVAKVKIAILFRAACWLNPFLAADTKSAFTWIVLAQIRPKGNLFPFLPEETRMVSTQVASAIPRELFLGRYTQCAAVNSCSRLISTPELERTPVCCQLSPFSRNKWSK
jgi:hypothetical protein